MSVPATRASEYVPEFDTLRAFAALAVMMSHFTEDINFLLSRLGWLGVILFFCLSGYLITGILLRCRDLQGSQSIWATLSRFYIRRALRIFPLYYFAIFLFLFILPSIRSNLLWFLLYAVNIGKVFGYSGTQGFVPLNHFWTLAVEEQFYIVWPFVILLLASKFHIPACVFMITLAILSRILLSNILDATPTAVQQLTFSCTDALGLGALFAVAESKYKNYPERLNLRAFQLLSVFLPLAVLTYISASDRNLSMLGPTVFSLAFAPLIFLIAKHSGSVRLAPLRYAPITYLGRISYGLYVWHLPVMWAYGKLVSMCFGWDILNRFPPVIAISTRTLLLSFFTLLIATCSWHLFENPINQMKSRFPYKLPASQK